MSPEVWGLIWTFYWGKGSTDQRNVVKSPRANSHDCLHIPLSPAGISLAWGSKREAAGQSLGAIPVCPTVQHWKWVFIWDPALLSRVLHHSQQQDSRTSSLGWKHTEFELCVIKTWAFYLLIKPNATADRNLNCPIIMKKETKTQLETSKFLPVTNAFSPSPLRLLYLEKSQNLQKGGVF